MHGIRTLVGLHAEANRLIQKAGKARPEEGSEHIFFYALEELTNKHYLHGEVVGAGIYIVTHYQTNDERTVANSMDSLGLMFRPTDYGISKEQFVSAVLHMKEYSRRGNLPFTVLDVADIRKEDAEQLWNDLSE